MGGGAMEPAEFDMVLPIRRRTLYLARNMAAVLLTFLVAAPVSGTVLLAAALRGGLREILWPWEIATLTGIALVLTLSPLLWLLNRTWKSATGPTFSMVGAIVAMLLVAVYAFLRKASAREIPILPLAVPVLLVAALAWLAGYWRFLRYELAPADSRRAPNSSRISLIDRLPPLARIMARALWLQLSYLFVVFFAVIYSLMLTAKVSRDFWSFYMMYAACSGVILVSFSNKCQALAPYLSRRAIIRCILGPIVPLPALIGGIGAITTRSPLMLVAGLALALMIVGMTWIALPSAREYRQPSLLRLRRFIALCPMLCFFLCGFVPPFYSFLQHTASGAWSQVGTHVGGSPALVSCVIVLAIALLWWRCERKFRDFEPLAFASGFARAA